MRMLLPVRFQAGRKWLSNRSSQWSAWENDHEPPASQFPNEVKVVLGIWKRARYYAQWVERITEPAAPEEST